MIALVFASAGCSGAGSDIASSTPPTLPDASGAAAPAQAAGTWWREAGDPVLAALVQHGLDASHEIACRMSALRQYDQDEAGRARRIDTKLGKLLGDKSARSNPAMREERVERVATRRARLARQIARSYVEVRRIQQDIALRNGLEKQYKDNAEVAQFRREAGLASAIDGALARSQSEAARGELGFAQGRLDTALAELATLTGHTPVDLAAKLGTSGAIPDPAIDPLSIVSVEDPRRAALADGVLREARLAQVLEEARRTVRDARIAYRQGVGAFSTLYVSEAAVTAVNLALVDARASRVTATFELWSTQNLGWAREGLAPPVGAHPALNGETITVTAACD